MEKGRIVLFAAGTGNPYFTTDTAAALRAAEMGCDALFKGTSVDGVYDADPKKVKDAKRFEELSYDEVIARNLQVMDTAAFALCRDNRIPLRIYDMMQPGALMRILRGEQIAGAPQELQAHLDDPLTASRATRRMSAAGASRSASICLASRELAA